MSIRTRSGRLMIAGMAMSFVVALAACASSDASVPSSQDAAATSAPDADVPAFDDLSPADFVDVIDNPYFPRVPAKKWVYEGMTDEGLRRTETEVLTEKLDVLDLRATVVSNQDYLDGQLTEDNRDYFVQDKVGNVWYLGEEVANHVDGVLHDHAGSWLAGDDGNIPGIVMLADPAANIGKSYRQEHLVDCPRDRAEVLSVTEHVDVRAGSFDDVVQTHDTSAVELDLDEHKFYAPGVGLVKTVDRTSGDEFELIDFTQA